MRRLALTPTGSRKEFERAKEILRDGSARPVERAAAVFVVLRSALPSSLMAPSHFALKLTGRRMWRLPNDVFRLADRLKDVRFACMDAVDLARRFAGDEKTLIYCDPPYRGRLGYDCKVDHDRLAEVLLAAPADASAIAISGYEGDHPELESAGWTVYTRRSRESVSSRRGIRIEGLWINRPPLDGARPPARDG